eukprot:scaffold6.g2789.t1
MQRLQRQGRVAMPEDSELQQAQQEAEPAEPAEPTPAPQRAPKPSGAARLQHTAQQPEPEQQQQRPQAVEEVVPEVVGEETMTAAEWERQRVEQLEREKEELLGFGPASSSREAEVLLEIMQAGAEVEETIVRHREEISESMLQASLSGQLAAELERKTASPALRLLDDVMNILDPTEPVELSAATAAALDAGRRRQAAARLRAAFGGGLPGADVMSLAAQLASAGETAVDQLLCDEVDPFAFLAEAAELAEANQRQLRQLEAALAQQAAALSQEQAAAVREVLRQRGEAGEVLQQALAIAREVQRQMGPDG